MLMVEGQSSRYSDVWNIHLFFVDTSALKGMKNLPVLHVNAKHVYSVEVHFSALYVYTLPLLFYFGLFNLSSM